MSWQQSDRRRRVFRLLVKTRVEAERRLGLSSSTKRRIARLRPAKLSWLASVYGSDKGVTAHQYVDLYESVLLPHRRSYTRVLEIGIYKGASISMWRDFFPNAEIFGLDIEAVEVPGPRITTLRGDQSAPETIERLRALGPFDLIVDDGSHKAEHILASFAGLFDSVKPGGWYVIEDMQTAYIAKGYNGGPPGQPDTAASLVKGLVDAVNRDEIREYFPEAAAALPRVAELRVHPRVTFIRRGGA
jgi:cephalosporin hydroxylase